MDKKCSACGKTHAPTEFSVDVRRKDKLSSVCKSCLNKKYLNRLEKRKCLTDMYCKNCDTTKNIQDFGTQMICKNCWATYKRGNRVFKLGVKNINTKKMNLKVYQSLSKRTLSNLNSGEANVNHMRYGVITECAELIDVEKRLLAYGKQYDLVNITEEIGDVAWYLSGYATMHNIDLPEHVIEEGLKKENLISLEHFKKLSKVEKSFELLSFCFCTMHTKENSLEFCKLSFLMLKYIAHDYNIKLSEALQKNVEKLQKRYEKTFTKEEALNRNTLAERKVLES
jgi:NTP pyrophosphatase (non-canonical NTP hydrolase)